jgi:hypothetical protein
MASGPGGSLGPSQLAICVRAQSEYMYESARGQWFRQLTASIRVSWQSWLKSDDDLCRSQRVMGPGNGCCAFESLGSLGLSQLVDRAWITEGPVFESSGSLGWTRLIDYVGHVRKLAVYGQFLLGSVDSPYLETGLVGSGSPTYCIRLSLWSVSEIIDSWGLSQQSGGRASWLLGSESDGVLGLIKVTECVRASSQSVFGYAGNPYQVYESVVRVGIN